MKNPGRPGAQGTFRFGRVVFPASIVGLVLLSMMGCSGKNYDYGTQVDPQTALKDTQNEINQLQSNTTLPPSVKATQLKHLQDQLDQLQGKGHQATAPGKPADVPAGAPPKSGPGG